MKITVREGNFPLKFVFRNNFILLPRRNYISQILFIFLFLEMIYGCIDTNVER